MDIILRYITLKNIICKLNIICINKIKGSIIKKTSYSVFNNNKSIKMAISHKVIQDAVFVATYSYYYIFHIGTILQY